LQTTREHTHSISQARKLKYQSTTVPVAAKNITTRTTNQMIELDRLLFVSGLSEITLASLFGKFVANFWEHHSALP
jgi:hypothetical protein